MSCDALNFVSEGGAGHIDHLFIFSFGGREGAQPSVDLI